MTGYLLRHLFDRTGGIVLCNRQMYRLSQYLLHSDMQYLGEVSERFPRHRRG